MEKFTITITRQFGSMGRTIARQLAEELGTEFYDRDIVEEVSRKLNLPVSQISESEEKSEYRFWSRMFPLGNDEANIQSSIFDAQKSIILDLAQKSSCIIVGRCSDAILEEANVENVINIYIYAPVQKRLENCITRLRVTLADPTLLNEALINKTENRGIVKKGNDVQIIYGMQVAEVRHAVEEQLAKL